MTSRRQRIAAWLGDLAVVAAFVAVGRSSHDEGPAGYASTVLPFFAALQSAWVVTGRFPLTLRTGAIVWAMTAAGGLLLRVAAGDTVAPGFLVVTTIVLGVGLIGWRLVVRGVRALRAPSHRRRPSGASS